MRSLSTKLTLAFLLFGILGVLLFSLLVGLQTKNEFNRFVSKRDQEVVVDTLADYYTRNDSWAGLGHAIAERPNVAMYLRATVIADAQGNVLLGGVNAVPGSPISAGTLASATPIEADGATIGFVVFGAPPANFRRPPSPIEQQFMRNALIAALASGIITVLAAFGVAGLMARTLSRPISELTTATRAMAAGDLAQQVDVHSNDEIGELATAFNQMSADLARGSMLRKQMTADLAHDLRTPLAILRGYAEGLKDERINGSPALFSLMHDEVVHLQRLVEDLRTLSLADAGEISLNRRTVDPRALLERAALLYLPAAEERGLTLRLDAPESLPSVEVDTDRMAQVLNNLVSNALRHTERGEIVLAAQPDSGWVEVEVRDTGRGIDADELPYVFDRFYRGDKSRQRTEADGASGLGLAIAKALVEAHGGTIDATSSPGAGATFQIRLPIAQTGA